MKTKEFTRDEFKAQCILIGIAIKEFPAMENDEMAERFTKFHYGEREYGEARVAVRHMLGIDAP